MGAREEFFHRVQFSKVPAAEITWTADWGVFDTGANDLVFTQVGRQCTLNGYIKYSGVTGSKASILNLFDARGSRIRLPKQQTAYGTSIDQGGAGAAFRLGLTTAGVLQLARPATWTATQNSAFPILLMWTDWSDF